jgi:hypothetical protein
LQAQQVSSSTAGNHRYDFLQTVSPKMLSALKFYWFSCKGYRLQPWRSPYIRWRMETFFGPEAAPADAGTFFRLTWRERARLLKFFRWAEIHRHEMRRKRSI